MDFNQFKLQIEAARQFEAPVEGITFRVRLPTDHDAHRAAEESLDALGRLRSVRWSRALCDEAVIGWEGATTRHILPEAEEAPLAYSAEARAALFDYRRDLVEELAEIISRRIRERREAREAARKNS